MKFLKVGAVLLGALVITTLGISASDTFSGNSGSLLSQLSGAPEEPCPAGMAHVVVGQTFSCVDRYEVSPSELCAYGKPGSSQETQSNINDRACMAESLPDAQPWTYVTRSQAQVLCARSGKRLPTGAEWYTFALGTTDNDVACNTNGGGAASAGAHASCESGVGVFDAIGNVWEWTTDDVFDGVYSNRALPEDGFVAQVDASGVATLTNDTPTEEFGADYFWHNPTGVYGLLRGGFFGSGEDAGLFSVHAKTAPTAATVAIGFRCVL